jgi:hypothetical protein
VQGMAHPGTKVFHPLADLMIIFHTGSIHSLVFP